MPTLKFNTNCLSSCLQESLRPELISTISLS